METEDFVLFAFIGIVLVCLISFIFAIAVETEAQDRREKECLQKGYHYVDGTCYKEIIPAD